MGLRKMSEEKQSEFVRPQETDIWKIYSDPYTKENYEGTALLIRLISEQKKGKFLVQRWIVLFEGDQKVERKICIEMD
jgi:hypothetical protein